MEKVERERERSEAVLNLTKAYEVLAMVEGEDARDLQSIISDEIKSLIQSPAESSGTGGGMKFG